MQGILQDFAQGGGANAQCMSVSGGSLWKKVVDQQKKGPSQLAQPSIKHLLCRAVCVCMN